MRKRIHMPAVAYALIPLGVADSGGIIVRKALVAINRHTGSGSSSNHSLTVLGFIV